MSDYRTQIDELRARDRAESAEYKIQIILVGCGVLAGWMFYGLWQLLVWFIATYGLSQFERRLHARPHQPYSFRLYVQYLALGTSIGVASNVLPALLWALEEPVYRFAAVVYIVGAALNTFIVRAKTGTALLCYAIPNAISLALIAGLIVRDEGVSIASAVTVLLAGLIIVYMMLMVMETARNAATLRKNLEELHHARRVETIANLAGGVAHDFNNLLSAILANLDMIRIETDAARKGELIEQAQTATKRGAMLTQQLLAVGRRSTLVREVVFLQSFFKDLHGLLSSLLPSYIQLKLSCDPAIDAIETDRTMLQSVIINLVLNARQAMSAGGVLDISVAPVSITDRRHLVTSGALAPGDYVEVTVKDSGSGIAPDVFGRVLEPFYTTQPKGEGTGLGLAMVDGHARQVGGGLDIRTELNVGTTVRFYLPLRAGQVDKTAPPSPEAPFEARKQGVGTSLLLAEDDAILRAVITRFLVDEGYDVRAFETGEDALAAVEDGFAPDLVVTDVVMPGTVQGPDLVRVLRPRLTQSGFVIMTGYAFNQDVELTADEGNHHNQVVALSKPFNLPQLRDVLVAARPVTPPPPAP